jgi:Phasin protein
MGSSAFREASIDAASQHGNRQRLILHGSMLILHCSKNGWERDMVAKPRKPKTTKQPSAAAALAVAEFASEPTTLEAKPAAANDAAPARPAPLYCAALPGFAAPDLAAIAHANAALVKGIEAAGREVAGFAQQNMTQAVDAARALVAVRTVADLVEINRNLAQATLDSVIAKSARLSEIGIRIATDAFGPLGEQLATALGRFARPVL